MSKFIKEAEQNVINQAKFWTDFLSFVDELDYTTINHLCEYADSDTKSLFSEGIHKIRMAAYQAQTKALARCFMIQGVGGTEAEEYSKNVAKNIFKEGTSIMPWLDANYRLPSYWRSDKEDSFRKELDAALSEEPK